ncbi:Two component transcriptional regulator, LuxR family [Verrucomicrobia bacterium]|nr:Two component transcriptional regulator, LuxR family [Verrucomicrobiota bacterium]
MNKRVNATIQVALVEDDDGVRANLARMIDSAPGFHCQGSYANGHAALQNIPASRPDVVLMDINMPGMLGTECVRRLKTVAPDIPVLMLTVYDDSEQVFKSLMAGATGYLLKRTPKDKLLEAIREINSGGAPMSRQIARRVVQYFQSIDQAPAARSAPEVGTLTEREGQVLKHLSQGYAYKEIAGLMNISFETVRTYVRSIYEKLHVHSRTAATLKYLGR